MLDNAKVFKYKTVSQNLPQVSSIMFHVQNHTN